MQLVVRDLAASRRFYGAVFEVLGIPIGGEEETYFWADELFIPRQQPRRARRLNGRHHLAFQAKDRAAVDAFHAAGLSLRVAATTARRACASTIGLLRRLPHRSGRQQHRGGVPRRAPAQRAVGAGDVLTKVGR